MSMQRNVFSWGVILGVGFGLVLPVTASRADEGLPRVRIERLEHAPVIDGRLDDAAWQRPPDITEFQQAGVSPAVPAETRTEVWMAHDDAWLHIAVRCHDEQAADIRCEHLERDGSVHLDESIEIFLSPGTDGRSYFHFRINACGIQGDNSIDGGRRSGWSGHWRSAARVDAEDGAWTVEMAIPLFYLADAAGDGPWRLNINRNRDRMTRGDTWAPLPAFSFHTPEAFGILEGLEAAPAAPLFAPVIQSARIGNMTDLPERGYEVITAVRNHGRVSGAVQVAAADVASAGVRWTDPAPLTLPAGHEAEITTWVRFDDYEPRSSVARLTLQDEVGAWIFDRAISWERSQDPFSAAMDRSYYTDETAFFVVYHSPLPGSFLAESRIRIIGDVLAEEFVTAPVRTEGRIRLPIERLPHGRSPLTVSFERNDGTVLQSINLEAIRRDPNPDGNTVKIDRWHRTVRVNGAPVFPHGFYSAPRVSHRLMAESAGADTAVVWGLEGRRMRDMPGNLLAYLDEASAHGLHLIASPLPAITWERRGHDQADERMESMRNRMLGKMPSVLGPLSSHPALLAYHLLDEPFRQDTVRDALHAIYRGLHAESGYHPAFVGDFRWMEGDPIWAELSDVAFPHSYWLPTGTEIRVPRRTLAQWREIQRAGRELFKPVWLGMVNEFHSVTRRMMTTEERRLAVYLAYIHEFTGLFYFAWPAIHETTHEDLRHIRAELETLKPALLTCSPAQAFQVEGVDADAVQALLKTHPEGGAVLLVANTLKLPMELELQLDGLPEGARVEPLFGASLGDDSPLPALTARNGAWRDELAPYGVRAYRLAALPAADGAPLSLTATVLNADAVNAGLAGDGIAGNLVATPGFETDDGWEGIDPEQGIRIDDRRAHRGERSLRLTRTNADAMPAIATSDPIRLKPNTRYRVGARVYGEIASGPSRWGGINISVVSLTHPGYRLTMQTHIHQIQGNWSLRSGYLDTPPDPETIRLQISAPRGRYTGDVWVDDIFVEEVHMRASRNLLPNSGFEHATREGYPDRWFAMPQPQWLAEETLTPRPDALVRQDFDEKVAGECSLRLRGYVWLNSAPTRHHEGVRLKANTDYVFSVYMKADREDYEVRFTAVDGQHHFVRVEPEWQRYHWMARTPEGSAPRLHVTLLPIGSMRYDGPAEDMPVFWVDAAQFEEGTEPTEYVPDAYDPASSGWMALE